MKKTKFNLLSYVVDEMLVFYESSNNKKIIGFMIAEIDDFSKFISLLSRFVSKRYIKYFSIQISIKTTKKNYIFICFEDENKNRLVKFHNILVEKLLQIDGNIKILRNTNLEVAFLNVFVKNVNFEMNVVPRSNSIFLNSDENPITINFYNLCLDVIEEKDTFIQSYEEYLISRGFECDLIFSFFFDNNSSIVVGSYLTETISNINNSKDIMEHINTFFKATLLKKKKINLKTLGYYLWRYKIFDENFYFKDCRNLFKIEKTFDFKNLKKFNIQFEQELIKNQVDFNRINDSLLLINDTSLFITMLKFEPKVLLELFKKYYSKYYLYLFAPIEGIYEELQKIEKINFLNKITILNKIDFLKFGFLDNHCETKPIENIIC